MINRDIIRDSLMEFDDAYGRPKHIKDMEHMVRVIDIYHRELSKHFTDHTINAAISVAWSKTRTFPSVADFFEGYGGKVEESGPTIESLGLVS